MIGIASKMLMLRLAPRPPNLGVNLNLDDTGNDTNTTLSPITTPETPIKQPPCQWILYEDIGESRVRIWDLIILVPNAIFLLFLLIKIRTAIVKLSRTNSPIFLAFYGLVFTVAVISVLRSIVSMTVNAAVPAGDYADRILWLVLRFFLLATELSVVIFGLAFGHLDSRTSIQRVLLMTISIALIYSSTQGVLEFIYTDERFHVATKSKTYNIFGHGGMLFWFASSVFFFVVYTVICILPLTKCHQRFAMPTKRTFYLYCFFLAILNMLQAIGSGLLYYHIQHGMCLVDATSYTYFTCFAPLVYCTFLWEFFKSSQPPDILFSYKAHVDDEEEDTVSLPHHPSSSHPGTSHKTERDPMSSSYDSTHFDTTSPNPLYTDCPEFHFSPELSINTEYYRENEDPNDDAVIT